MGVGSCARGYKSDAMCFFLAHATAQRLVCKTRVPLKQPSDLAIFHTAITIIIDLLKEPLIVPFKGTLNSIR